MRRTPIALIACVAVAFTNSVPASADPDAEFESELKRIWCLWAKGLQRVDRQDYLPADVQQRRSRRVPIGQVQLRSTGQSHHYRQTWRFLGAGAGKCELSGLTSSKLTIW